MIYPISGRKRHRPKENLPPGDQDPVIWRVSRNLRLCRSNAPGIPGRAGCFKHRRPDRRTRAGPGVSPRAGPDPKQQRLYRRVRARWLHRARKISRFLQSPQARNNPVKSVLCTCHEIPVAWKMVFVFLPLKLLLPCGARIDCSLFLFLICWPTHSLCADFFTDRNLETPLCDRHRWKPRIRKVREAEPLWLPKRNWSKIRDLLTGTIFFLWPSLVFVPSLSLSLVPSVAARKSRANAATPHLAARAGFRVFWSRVLFVGLGELERKERPCWVVKARARFLASWVLEFLDFEALVGTRKWAQE
jgi:hypothetical protein